MLLSICRRNNQFEGVVNNEWKTPLRIQCAPRILNARIRSAEFFCRCFLFEIKLRSAVNWRVHTPIVSATNPSRWHLLNLDVFLVIEVVWLQRRMAGPDPGRPKSPGRTGPGKWRRNKDTEVHINLDWNIKLCTLWRSFVLYWKKICTSVLNNCFWLCIYSFFFLCTSDHIKIFSVQFTDLNWALFALFALFAL